MVKSKYLRKKNNNRNYKSRKSGVPNGGKPQLSQLMLQAPPLTPTLNIR